jgi:glycosyltransferase involved in cell wall biosynthesis
LLEKKISVLIRSYNESKWIGMCLENIMEQTVKPFEVLLIDNKSNDGTIELAKNTYKNIRIYKYNKNYTPGGMLNFGIEKTKSNYILIISAHCIPFDKNVIKNLLIIFLDELRSSNPRYSY